MALSGSVDFNQTRNDIINRSLRIIGALESGENATADEVADASDTLNAMVKAWQGTGYRLWTKKEGVLFLTKGQARYTLGPNSTDHATEESDAKKTALAVAAVATDATITVDSDDDIADADNIGIVLDSGAFHWTTVNGAPVGDVVTLTVAMPSAAAVGKKVHSYTSGLVRPRTSTARFGSPSPSRSRISTPRRTTRTFPRNGSSACTSISRFGWRLNMARRSATS